MKTSTKPVRGTRDFGPRDMELRDYVQQTIIEIYREAGFSRIQTPVLEDIDNLLGSDGGENLKLIFKILKRGDKLQLDKEGLSEVELSDMGLRYDLTLPLSRFYADNQAILPAIFKSIQVGEVFRAERPQKGRFRSFVQCDIDIIGEEDCNAEMELILTTTKALNKLDFKNFIVRINDRRVLKSTIEYAGFPSEEVGKVCIILDKLDKIGLEGVKKELLSCEYNNEWVEKFLEVLKELESNGLDKLKEFGVEEKVVDDLKSVLEVVTSQANGTYEIKFDPSLVRGMGYYTGMIFEIEYSDFGCSVAGGGRYDKMIGRFMKKDVPAVGFSIGFERILTILEEKGFKIPNRNEKIAFLYEKGKDNMVEVFKEADKIRETGKKVCLIPKQKKVGKQIDKLQEQGFDAFCIYNVEGFEIKSL